MTKNSCFVCPSFDGESSVRAFYQMPHDLEGPVEQCEKHPGRLIIVGNTDLLTNILGIITSHERESFKKKEGQHGVLNTAHITTSECWGSMKRITTRVEPTKLRDFSDNSGRFNFRF